MITTTQNIVRFYVSICSSPFFSNPIQMVLWNSWILFSYVLCVHDRDRTQSKSSELVSEWASASRAHMRWDDMCSVIVYCDRDRSKLIHFKNTHIWLWRQAPRMTAFMCFVYTYLNVSTNTYLDMCVRLEWESDCGICIHVWWAACGYAVCVCVCLNVLCMCLRPQQLAAAHSSGSLGFVLVLRRAVVVWISKVSHTLGAATARVSLYIARGYKHYTRELVVMP